MSESAGAASAGATGGSADAGSAGADGGSANQNQQVQGQGQSPSANRAANNGAYGKTAPGSESNSGREQSQGQNESGDDDHEEIALGSVKGKVPKALAKAIKDFERGVQTKMESAARARKEFESREQLLQMFDSDPDAFAENYGRLTGKRVDLDAMAEQRLAKKYEIMQMSPEQRQLMEAQQQIENFKKQELSTKQGAIDQIKELLGADAPKGLENASKEQLDRFLQAKQQEFQQLQGGLEKELLDAWKDSGLPKDPYFGALMSFEMISHQKRTKESLPAGEAAARVKSRFTNQIRQVFSQMDPQGIQELLGQEMVAKLRQYDVDRVTAKAASQVGQTNRPGGHTSASESTPKKYVNQFEWRKAMGLD